MCPTWRTPPGSSRSCSIGWAPEELLDSYHTERHAAAIENLDITSATMRFLVPHGEQEWRHRRGLLERAVSDPRARAQVDSGRFAEPFWYIDSALTTPDPARRFPGRPPKGEMPAVVPGVIVPDAPVSVPDQPGVSRLRELVRDGLLVLTTGGVDAAAVAAEVKETTEAPYRVLRLGEIDAEGAVAAALGARLDEAWLIRPDGHVAAVLTAPDRHVVRTATRRALGEPH